METLIIGKPAINIYLPLQEFPKEGDLFTIKSKVESLGNVGATSACLISKWGLKVHFTGVTGNDVYAEKIRDTFREYHVDTKYLETDFERDTSCNYIILNTKDGIVSKVLFNNPEAQLQKFKYDFIPDWALIDGTDFSGAHALLNNNGSVKTVFYARLGDKDTIAMAKRCTWVVCTQLFAEMLTHEVCDGTAEGYVNLFQKIVDAAGKSNYVVILNNHKILYSESGQVKMLPEMKMNTQDYSSYDSIFTGAFMFGLMNEVSVDDSIKLAEMAAAISIGKIGETTALPELTDVIDNAGLTDKLNLHIEKKVIQPSASEIINGGAPAPMATLGSTTPAVQQPETAQTQVQPAVSQVDAFAQAPAQPQEAPAQQVSSIYDSITPVEQNQHVETNIFDNPNV